MITIFKISITRHQLGALGFLHICKIFLSSDYYIILLNRKNRSKTIFVWQNIPLSKIFSQISTLTSLSSNYLQSLKPNIYKGTMSTTFSRKKYVVYFLLYKIFLY